MFIYNCFFGNEASNTTSTPPRNIDIEQQGTLQENSRVPDNVRDMHSQSRNGICYKLLNSNSTCYRLLRWTGIVMLGYVTTEAYKSYMSSSTTGLIQGDNLGDIERRRLESTTISIGGFDITIQNDIVVGLDLGNSTLQDVQQWSNLLGNLTENILNQTFMETLETATVAMDGATETVSNLNNSVSPMLGDLYDGLSETGQTLQQFRDTVIQLQDVARNINVLIDQFYNDPGTNLTTIANGLSDLSQNIVLAEQLSDNITTMLPVMSQNFAQFSNISNQLSHSVIPNTTQFIISGLGFTQNLTTLLTQGLNPLLNVTEPHIPHIVGNGSSALQQTVMVLAGVDLFFQALDRGLPSLDGNGFSTVRRWMRDMGVYALNEYVTWTALAIHGALVLLELYLYCRCMRPFHRERLQMLGDFDSGVNSLRQFFQEFATYLMRSRTDVRVPPPQQHSGQLRPIVVDTNNENSVNLSVSDSHNMLPFSHELPHGSSHKIPPFFNQRTDFMAGQDSWLLSSHVKDDKQHIKETVVNEDLNEDLKEDEYESNNSNDP